AYRAWRAPRVRNLTQYVWRDERLGPGGAGWQSGLRFADDRPKPALRGFPQPFWADQTVARRAARLWGQGRPGGSAVVRGFQEDERATHFRTGLLRAARRGDGPRGLPLHVAADARGCAASERR